MSYMDEFISAIQFAHDLFPQQKPIKTSSQDGMKAFFNNFCSQPEFDPLFNPGGAIHKAALRFIQDYPFSEVAQQGEKITQQFFNQTRDKVFNSGFWVGVTIGDISWNGRSVYGTTRDSIKESLSPQPSNAPSRQKFHVWLTFGNLQILDLTVVPSLLRQEIAKPTEFKDKLLISTKPRRTSKLRYTPLLVHNDFLSLVGSESSSVTDYSLK